MEIFLNLRNLNFKLNLSNYNLPHAKCKYQYRYYHNQDWKYCDMIILHMETEKLRSGECFMYLLNFVREGASRHFLAQSYWVCEEELAAGIFSTL